jgi:DNA-binding Lrp family transcriptional regulator
MPNLTLVDKKLLKLMLSPGVKGSSKSIARQLKIPATTVQRRRKRLEREFLKVSYELDVTKFGWHKVDFLISTENGRSESVARALLKRDEVISVDLCIGLHTIDLRVEAILKDNAEILRMLELIRAMVGVKDAQWSEIVKTLGRKRSIPAQIIDML